MKSLKRAALAVLVVGVVLVVFLCCSFVLFEGAPSYLVFPSTRTIAKRYLEVVIAGDVKQVGRLAGSDGECQVLMQELAQADMEKLKGAEVRNIEIDVNYSTGSTEELEFATIRFEYCTFSHPEWQAASMRLMTDYKFPGRRYACGRQP
jgi:hypothetical protein